MADKIGDEDARMTVALQHSIVSGKLGEAIAWGVYFGVSDGALRDVFELCLHMVKEGAKAAAEGTPEENSAALERLTNLFTRRKPTLKSVPPTDPKEPA